MCKDFGYLPVMNPQQKDGERGSPFSGSDYIPFIDSPDAPPCPESCCDLWFGLPLAVGYVCLCCTLQPGTVGPLVSQQGQAWAPKLMLCGVASCIPHFATGMKSAVKVHPAQCKQLRQMLCLRTYLREYSTTLALAQSDDDPDETVYPNPEAVLYSVPKHCLYTAYVDRAT
eukprot:gene6122-biopygen5192